MFHGQSKFGQQITGVNSANCRAQDFIFPGRSNDFDFAVIRTVGDCTIQIVDAISCDFVRNVVCFCFILAESNPCQFRIGVGTPRNNRIIHRKFFERRKKGVDGGIPRLVSGHVSELIWSRHIPASENVRNAGAQILVDFDSFVFIQFHSQILQSKAGSVWNTSDGNQNIIHIQMLFIAVS